MLFYYLHNVRDYISNAICQETTKESLWGELLNGEVMLMLRMNT